MVTGFLPQVVARANLEIKYDKAEFISLIHTLIDHVTVLGKNMVGWL